MFNIGPAEFAVIALVALIFIRPKDLPAMLRKVAKAWKEVKKAVNELTAMKDDFMSQVNELSKEVEDATTEVKDALKLQEEGRAAKEGSSDQASLSPAPPANPYQDSKPEGIPLASFDASAPQEALGYDGTRPEQEPPTKE